MDLLVAALAGLLLGWLVAGGSAGSSRRREDPPGSAQMRSWLEEAPSGWLLLDAADTAHLINLRARRLLQLPAAGPALPAPLATLCPAPELAEILQSARRRQRPQRREWERDDREIELFALPGAEGWVALVLLSRRSLEAQVEQQERWVSDVAHELKTPLTALLLVGDSLAAQANPRNAVLVERLQRELLRLQELVGDLLELSRLENTLPGQPRSRTAVALSPLVERVWAGLRPLAETRGIRLELREEPQAHGPVAVPGDESRLHRALLNLLDNAVRYSPDGGCVRVRIEADRSWCRLTVRDEGPGLSEEDLARMFERFYRGDPARVRSRRVGSGLGLAIVQQIAVTHGGRVQAANHPAGGALLELLLPVPG